MSPGCTGSGAFGSTPPAAEPSVAALSAGGTEAIVGAPLADAVGAADADRGALGRRRNGRHGRGSTRRRAATGGDRHAENGEEPEADAFVHPVERTDGGVSGSRTEGEGTADIAPDRATGPTKRSAPVPLRRAGRTDPARRGRRAHRRDAPAGAHGTGYDGRVGSLRSGGDRRRRAGCRPTSCSSTSGFPTSTGSTCAGRSSRADPTTRDRHADRARRRARRRRRPRRRRRRLRDEAVPARRAARSHPRPPAPRPARPRPPRTSVGRPRRSTRRPARGLVGGDASSSCGAKEFDLLARLVVDAGTRVTRETLMTDVWDEHWFGSTKTLDVHIAGAAPQDRRPGAARVGSRRCAASATASSGR